MPRRGAAAASPPPRRAGCNPETWKAGVLGRGHEGQLARLPDFKAATAQRCCEGLGRLRDEKESTGCQHLGAGIGEQDRAVQELDTDEVQHLFVKDGKVMVGFEEGAELRPAALNKFHTADSSVEVIFEGGLNGEPLQARVSAYQQPMVYTAVVAASPSSAQLTE